MIETADATITRLFDRNLMLSEQNRKYRDVLNQIVTRYETSSFDNYEFEWISWHEEARRVLDGDT